MSNFLLAGIYIYIVVNDDIHALKKKMRRLDARSMVLFGVPFGLDLCEIAASIIHSLLLPLQSLSQLALLCCCMRRRGFLLSFNFACPWIVTVRRGEPSKVQVDHYMRVHAGWPADPWKPLEDRHQKS